MRTAFLLSTALVAFFSLALPASSQGPAGLPASAPAKASAPDPQIEAARARYRASLWAEGDRRGGFPLASFEIAGLRAQPIELPLAVAPGEISGPLVRRYAAARADVCLIELRVLETAREAHESLLRLLAFVQSPGAVPPATDANVSVGEAAYVGFSAAAPGRISWLAFVRGNVVFRIASTDTSTEFAPGIAAIARQLDAALIAQPRLAPSAALPRPRVMAPLVAAGASVKAGEVLPLRVELEGAGAPPTLSWTVGGPGQGYVESDARGHRFHATGEGAVTLVLQVASADGALAQASASVAVVAAR